MIPEAGGSSPLTHPYEKPRKPSVSGAFFVQTGRISQTANLHIVTSPRFQNLLAPPLGKITNQIVGFPGVPGEVKQRLLATVGEIKLFAISPTGRYHTLAYFCVLYFGAKQLILSASLPSSHIVEHAGQRVVSSERRDNGALRLSHPFQLNLFSMQCEQSRERNSFREAGAAVSRSIISRPVIRLNLAKFLGYNLSIIRTESSTSLKRNVHL